VVGCGREIYRRKKNRIKRSNKGSRETDSHLGREKGLREILRIIKGSNRARHPAWREKKLEQTHLGGRGI